MGKTFDWAFYTTKCDGTTIMVCFVEDEGWEIYYKRPMYPFMFAFGLPEVHTITEVFDIAKANIVHYEDLFN